MKIFKRNTGDIDDEYDDLNRFPTISNCEDDDMTSKKYQLVTNAAVSASFLEVSKKSQKYMYTRKYGENQIDKYEFDK